MIKHKIYMLFFMLIALMFFICQMLFLNLVWNDARASNSEMQNMNVVKLSEAGKPMAGMQSYTVISSEQNSASFKNVKKSLDLLRFPYTAYSSVDEMPQPAPQGLTAVIICDSNLDRIGDIENLLKYLKLKVKTYFVSRLDTYSAAYRQHQELFGIEENRGMYLQEGIDFLDEVLVTGLEFNSKIEVQANKVKVNGKCKVLAVGFDETIEKYNDRTPIIWRTYYENGGAMFFFNADFMEDIGHIGILTGVLSLNEDVFIYPIVNTNIMLIDGLPYLSTENSDKIRNAYLRNIEQFQCDVLWNDLVAIAKNLGIKYSLYPTIGTQQDEMEDLVISYFGKEIYVNNFELGYFHSNRFESILANYKPVTQMHYDSESAIGKILVDDFDFRFEDENTVTVPVVTEGQELEGPDRLRSFSIASAIGYIAHHLDINSDIFSAESDSDMWTHYKLDFTQNIYPLVKLYEYLERETAAQAAEKISIYLNCVPQIETDDNSIRIKSQPAGTTSYILRTTRIIEGAENCSVYNIRSDFYMVTVDDKDATIYTSFE